MKYSIVVPFFNEQESIREFYRTLSAAMQRISDDCEFVFVDDGSRDSSFDILQEIAEHDERVVIVRLRRNYGKTEALVAGFEHVSGEYVIAMDGDLQHNPEEIALFVQKFNEGFDVVCGCRVKRPGDNVLLKRIPSRIANWMMRKLTRVEIHDFGGGYKGYRTQLIRKIPLYGELQRFIPALAVAYGATICEVPIHIAERRHGRSHYGIGRAIPVFFDLITIPFLLRYVSRPMYFFGSFGMVALAAGGAIGLTLSALSLLFGVHVMENHGPLMFFGAVLILGGLQLVGLGLLGEMQVRHFHQRADAFRESAVLRVVKRRE